MAMRLDGAKGHWNLVEFQYRSHQAWRETTVRASPEFQLREVALCNSQGSQLFSVLLESGLCVVPVGAVPWSTAAACLSTARVNNSCEYPKMRDQAMI